MRAFEILRIHLKKLYEMSEDNEKPSLQYVALLDLSQLSLQSLVSSSLSRFYFFIYFKSIIQNIDLFTWTLREVIPRFPGMIAAGEFSNWSSQSRVNNCFDQYLCLIIHGLMRASGACSSSFVSFTQLKILLISSLRRLLPEVALSRIFFPSKQELVKYFGPSNLPQGTPFDFLEDKCTMLMIINNRLWWNSTLVIVSRRSHPAWTTSTSRRIRNCGVRTWAHITAESLLHVNILVITDVTFKPVLWIPCFIVLKTWPSVFSSWSTSEARPGSHPRHAILDAMAEAHCCSAVCNSDALRSQTRLSERKFTISCFHIALASVQQAFDLKLTLPVMPMFLMYPRCPALSGTTITF